MQLVLSLMPGIDLLGMAFKREGFAVVQGGDVIFGGDVREEHYPPGRFDGVISGPPCQAFSEVTEINKGRMAPRDNLIPEFERCVGEVQPDWFVMENVRRAPLPRVDGYDVADYLLNARWFGSPQKRIRRFSFGSHEGRRLAIEPSLLRPAFVARTVLASDGKRNGKGGCRHGKQNALERQKHTFEEACRYQGLPDNFIETGGHTRVFTKEGRWLLIGNGVPLPMGRAIARAVKEATEANVKG